MQIKTDNKSDITLDPAQQMLHKAVYFLQIEGRCVKVVFSDNPNAYTIENVLVKIATRRIS